MLEAYIIRKIREEEERAREERQRPRVHKSYYPPEPELKEPQRPIPEEDVEEENDGAIEVDI